MKLLQQEETAADEVRRNKSHDLLLLLTMESVYMPHVIYGMTWLGIDIPSRTPSLRTGGWRY